MTAEQSIISLRAASLLARPATSALCRGLGEARPAGGGAAVSNPGSALCWRRAALVLPYFLNVNGFSAVAKQGFCPTSTQSRPQRIFI